VRGSNPPSVTFLLVGDPQGSVGLFSVAGWRTPSPTRASLLPKSKRSTTTTGGLVKIEESVERINQALDDNEVRPDELDAYVGTLGPVEGVVFREAWQRLTTLRVSYRRTVREP
jgi:hypothetical protein